MGKLLWPDWYFDDFTRIPPDFFKKNNIRYLICDIDNTLVTYDDAEPTEKVIGFFDRIKKEGVHPAFASNNDEGRVATFARKTGFPAVHKAGKPFGRGVGTAMRLLGAERKRTAMLGDQIFTDLLAARTAGVRMILVKPIKDKPSLLFRIKRYFEQMSIDRYLRRYEINASNPERKMKRKMKKLRKKLRREQRKKERK
ncbi:MAG: YqeG family HAD IIIA-type phosphatase [Clostridia bacterium]|nr:YqeG family HAD IIIA-type phosphatase [Clostridia bacterium]